jgi:GH25 family lysozyme M1 (1,4-beta-N-acetylmuramidase)
MKKHLLLLLIVCITQAKAQTCGSGGCAAIDTNATGKYPAATFSTSSSAWTTVSAFMNAGNYTLFNVTNGNTYEWSYCSDFGGSQAWDAELTLFNNTTGATLCYQNNCGRSSCATAPYIRWTASFTGIVKLLTTVSGCGTNTGSPYSKLVWRDTSGTVPIQIIGVDVYSGNGTINWTQVKAAGYSFAYAKATEGVGYTDSQYLNYAVNGVNAGMKMGAYHFARPDLNPTNAGAIAEANYFLSVAQPYIISCQLPPSLDLEGSYLTTSFTSAQLTAWVQNWMTTVETATGIKPVLYIGASTVSYLNSSLNTYPLWRDELTGSPSPATNLGVWTTWAFNQYSWTGTVPGIAGSQTDLNFFNGNTMAAFNSFMGCNIATDIGVPNTNSTFVIYPNPTTGLFTMETNSTDILVMNIYDVNGRLVFSKNVSDKIPIDVTMLDEGFYTMTLKFVDHEITKKLVIVR